MDINYDEEMTFTYKNTNGMEITLKTHVSDMDMVCEMFGHFLHGCGFVFDEPIGRVYEECIEKTEDE